MSYQRDRDDFIARMSREGLDVETARLLLRYATTLQRLAVAQCNGDWPYGDSPDGPRRNSIVCARCNQSWASSSFRRPARRLEPVCPDCYAEAHVRMLLHGTPFQPVFQGDPRGAVLRLAPVGASWEDIDCGRVHGIYVPSRDI